MVMRRWVLVLVLVLLAPALAAGQIMTKPPRVSEEGTLVSPPRWTTNFIGTAVTCVDDAANERTNCTVTAGGGAGNFVDTTIAMTAGAGFYSTVVTGQTWVASGSVIQCVPFGTTADSLTPEQVAIAGLHVTTSDRVVGTGFTINVRNPTGSYGTHRIHCTGA